MDFQPCRVGLPAVRVGTVEDEVAASGQHEGARHRAGQPSIATQWQYSGSQLCVSGGGRVEASSWLLEAGNSEAESQEASLQMPSGGPPCSSPLYHPVAEGVAGLYGVAVL